MIVVVLRTKPSGLYGHRRGLGLHKVGYREGDLTSESPSLPSTQRRVPPGHGTKTSVLYLHSPIVRHKHIVRLSEDPLIQDSLNKLGHRNFPVLSSAGRSKYPNFQACLPRKGESHLDTGQSLQSCIFIVQQSGISI